MQEYNLSTPPTSALVLLATTAVMIHQRHNRFGLFSTISFIGIAFGLSTLAVYVISGGPPPGSSNGKVIATVSIAYAASIAYAIGVTAGTTFKSRISRFSRIMALRTDLIDALDLLDTNGYALASPADRGALLRKIFSISEHLEFGLSSNGRLYSQLSPEMHLQFKESAAYVRSLTEQVIAPKDSTPSDLIREFSIILAAVLTGRLHYLPRLTITQALKMRIPRAFLNSVRGLIASAIPAAVLFAADAMGLLPEGLRGWLLAVSLLGLAIGVAIILNPRSATGIERAAALLPFQGPGGTTATPAPAQPNSGIATQTK